MLQSDTLCRITDIQERLNMMRNARGSLLVFSGFNGTDEELGLVSTNFWLFKNNDMDKSYVCRELIILNRDAVLVNHKEALLYKQ